MKYLNIFFFILLMSCSNNSTKDVFDIARHGTISEMNNLIKENHQIINTKNKAGYSPLILASYHNNVKIIPFLIKNGAKVNETSKMGTALMAACYKENNDIAKILIDNDANVNAHDSNGSTALHYACLTNNKDLTKLLIKNNASIKAKDVKGKTPLDYAIEKNNIELIKLLNPN